jgi:anaerobic ribonucleoside-triphosphate reductase activating protein
MVFFGGEPFQQAGALVELVERARGLRPDLGVISYSGYELDALRGGTPAQQRLLQLLDVLIDGPFDLRQRLDDPLRGSANQVVHYLTGRVGPEDLVTPESRRAEILCADDRVVFIGALTSAQIRTVERTLRDEYGITYTHRTI